nr:PREDICTED: uncharacterized protein LOC109042400 [Bemisia tabaci]
MRFWILLGLLTCFSPSSSFQAGYMSRPSMLGLSNSFRERAQSAWRSMSNSMSRSRGRWRSDLGRSNSGSFAPTNWPDPEPLTRTPNYPAALERRYHMPAQTPYEYPS